MPLPVSVKTVPVHVKVVSQDGAVGIGKIRLEGPVALKDATSNTVVGAPKYSGTLDNNGEIIFPSVIATDTVNVSPTGWSYTFTAEVDTWRDRFQLQVPSATVGTLEIAQTASSIPGVASVTYVLASSAGAPSGVATLDNTGIVPAAQSRVKSVSGKTGVVTLVEADIANLIADLAAKLNKAGDTMTGPLLFGDGTVADVNIYRSSPGTIRTDGAMSVAGGVGFNGSNPVAKPTVSGSRGGNAALASMLTALALQGLITDSTTA